MECEGDEIRSKQTSTNDRTLTVNTMALTKSSLQKLIFRTKIFDTISLETPQSNGHNLRLTFVIMMSIGYSMGCLSGFIVLVLVRLATQALVAFIAATMTNTAEWYRRSQNAPIG